MDNNQKSLKEWRTIRSISQRDLAEAAGVSAENICRMERSFRVPYAKTARKLASALNIEPTQIRWHMQAEDVMPVVRPMPGALLPESESQSRIQELEKQLVHVNKVLDDLCFNQRELIKQLINVERHIGLNVRLSVEKSDGVHVTELPREGKR